MIQYKKTNLALVCALILCATTPVFAKNDSALCADAIAFHEREANIPPQLLTAISHVESGRYDKKSKAFFAWPWTVNSQGKGHFFKSKDEAIRFVSSLQAKGVRSIDVGCMQINLHHHADAFDSLESAFDPNTNVAYAAKFLKGLFNENKNWLVAAGFYHSQTPSFSNPYRLKVVDRWNSARKLAGGETVPQIAKAPSTPRVIQVASRAKPLSDTRPVRQLGVKALDTKGLTIYEIDAKRKQAVMIAWEERKRQQLQNRARYVNATKYRNIQLAQR